MRVKGSKVARYALSYDGSFYHSKHGQDHGLRGPSDTIWSVRFLSRSWDRTSKHFSVLYSGTVVSRGLPWLIVAGRQSWRHLHSHCPSDLCPLFEASKAIHWLSLSCQAHPTFPADKHVERLVLRFGVSTYVGHALLDQSIVILAAQVLVNSS